MNEFDAKGMKWYQVLTALIMGVVVCSLFGSCRSQFVDISDEMFIHDTIRVEVDRLRTDTFIQHDSIWHYECLKGDSVIVKDVVYKYIYKPKVEYRDSIVYRDREKIHIQEKEVQKKQSWWSKMLQVFGGISLLTVFGFIGLNLWRWYKGK